MIFEEDARDELRAAVAWYEDEREGLGTELLDAVESTLARISEAPSAFPSDPFDDRARRALVPRFPYAIVFLVQVAGVRVVAFAHSKRRPGYWRKRL